MTRRQKSPFQVLRDGTVKTDRACAIKKMAMPFWNYVSRIRFEKGRKRWLP